MGEGSDFLYPFLDEEPGDHVDASALLEDLACSAVAKAVTSAALRRRTLDALAPAIATAGAALAERFAAGGRLLTFGNGGSSTDAAGIAGLFATPPHGRPRPARCLADDQAVLTALANDVGFDNVFARQVIAHGRPEDIALGVSTSGDSRNVLFALDEASRRGLLTIGFAGYAGGAMAASAALDHVLVVDSDSVHRIQETQAALAVALWETVQRSEEPAVPADREEVRHAR